MKIGIIGIGDFGGTLARKLRNAGHELRVANSRGVESVRPFAEEIGAKPVDVHGAVEDVDAVILSIPLPAVANLPKGLFDNLPDGVPILDTGNYYPHFRDPDIKEIDDGMVEAIWVTRQIGRPIIKAFSNILTHTLELGRPRGAADRIAAAVSGDDPKGKALAMRLVDDVGLDPVDAGSLEDSWRIQPMTPGYCCDYQADEMRKGIAAARKGEARKRVHSLHEALANLGPNPSHADIIAMNRERNVAQP